MTQERKTLTDKKVAILATNGFEEIELTAPKKELEGYGATVEILSNEHKIKSWDKTNWGQDFQTDKLIKHANVDDYDALILPGGVINGDKLRRDEEAVQMIKTFSMKNKLIAAICHGPQLLIEADLVNGKKLTSHPAIKTDIKNAGASYLEIGVAEDENLITAQGPNDISGFMKKIYEYLKPVV
ncbi:MAG: DJ-1/PfpI/YhbO family deglycase/protease [Bacteroidota bacterium]